jgi:replicative DNA helicase Mcm
MSTAAEADDALVDEFEDFLSTYLHEDVLELAKLYPEEQSLTVDWWDLFQFNNDLADDLLTHPERIRENIEVALKNYDIPVDIDLSGAHARFTNLPDDATRVVGQYRSEEVSDMIAIKGIVNKSTGVLAKPDQLAFVCQRCGCFNHIPQSDGFQEPHECEACERQGPFQINYDESDFHDYRVVRVQLPPDEAVGQEGETIDVHLEYDLVEDVAPGDRVTIPAILRIEREDEDSAAFSYYADARGVDVLETDFEDVDIEPDERERIEEIADAGDPYQRLVDSFCPTIKGHEQVKEALLLQLFGGVTKELADGSVERGLPHMLLVGDPGTGKSEQIEYSADIAPRSVYTNGKGSSSAGLTAAAVRNDFGVGGEWAIEGGAIVKADKGLAAIDELDKMADDDRDSLHEALEQMTVSVSKAGKTPTLSARTTVLAAANPVEGRFDQYAPIAEQIDLDPALISRFDLIFTFSDEPDREFDKDIIGHKTDVWEVGAERAANDSPVDQSHDNAVEPDLGKDFLRKYIAYAKSKCKPVPTQAAKQRVREEFLSLRMANGADDDKPVPVTFRKQEAIHRLAEASARVRLSQQVEERDVSRAMRLVMETLRQVGIDPESGDLDADVVETGQSKSQRERKRDVKEIIKEVSKEDDDFGAKIGAVVQRAQDAGFDSQKVHYDIDKLKQDGKAYHPDTEGKRIELT